MQRPGNALQRAKFDALRSAGLKSADRRLTHVGELAERLLRQFALAAELLQPPSELNHADMIPLPVY